MTMIVENLAFGLEWFVAITDDSKELSTLLKTHKANAYCTLDSGRTKAYGIGTVKKVTDFQSAAASFAQFRDTEPGIFVHQITADASCFIACEEGVPAPGTDIVGPRSEIVEMANEYAREHRISPGHVFGDLTTFEIENSTPMGIDQLAGEATKATALHSASTVITKVALAGALAALSILAWFSPDIAHLFSPPKKPVVQLTNESKYHQKITDSLTQVAKEDRFQADVMPAFIKFADSLPFAVKGWKFESLTCDDVKCKAIWLRVTGGSAEGILSALNIARQDPSVTFPTVDRLQKTMTYTRKVQPGVLDFSNNATMDPKVLTWVQNLKDRGFAPKYSSAIALIAPDSATKPDKQDQILVGDYTILLPYREIAETSKIPNSMTIDRIGVQLVDGQVIASIEGKYYAR